MRLYLDDIREPPDGWVWVRTVPEARQWLSIGNVTHLSCDNDLGDGEPEGYQLLNWLEERAANGHEPPHTITVHSANAARRPSMEATIRSIAALWETRK